MKSHTESPTESVTNVCHSGPISDAVVTAVADAKGVDPLEVEPLHAAIDPDALDSLFDPRIGSPPAALELTFVLDGCAVELSADGEVVVSAAGADEAGATPAAPVAEE